MELIQRKEVKNLKKTIITIFTIFLIITSGVNFVSAENSTEEAVKNTGTAQQEETIPQRNAEEEKSRVGESVKSKENGHFNITFEDGYNGYCINYGDHEAKVNDEFEVKDTTSAINNKNGESIGHYLKTFFVEFHDIAVKNKYDTQKIIWAFSDNFDSNKALVQQIKDTSVNLTIPDHGAVKKINETTEAFFDFEVLSTNKNNHQNFFGYKITYRNIPVESENNTVEKEENKPNLSTPFENNTTEKQENTTIPQENKTENKTQENTTIPQENKTEIPQENKTENKTQENTTIPQENKTENITVLNSKNQTEDLKDNTKSENENKPVSLVKHATGTELTVAILALIFGFVLVGKYYKRD